MSFRALRQSVCFFMNLNVFAVLLFVTADSLHNTVLNLSPNTVTQRAPFWPDGVLSVWREGQGRARSVCVSVYQCISGFDTLIRADVLLLQWRLPLPPPGLWTRAAVEQRANVCLIPDLSSTPALTGAGPGARQMGAGCVRRGVFMSLEYWLLLFGGKLVEFVFVCGA